jgi:methanogenic corrinoid protein MtbC1
LDSLLESLHAADDAPGLVATTLSGETHELGAMLAAIIGATEGWRVLYPGPDLPADDIALSARVTDAAVVLISVVSPLSRRSLAGKTRRLVEVLPEATSLIVGGPGAAAHADAIEAEGATFLADLDALATELRSLASSATGPGGSSSKTPAGAAVS